MPATNRATGRPVPQKGDQTAVQAQALEAQEAQKAAEAAQRLEARRAEDKARAQKALDDMVLNAKPVGDVTVAVSAWSGRPFTVTVDATAKVRLGATTASRAPDPRRSHKKIVPLTAAQVAQAEAEALQAKQAKEEKAAQDVGEVTVEISLSLKNWKRGLHATLVIPEDDQ